MNDDPHGASRNRFDEALRRFAVRSPVIPAEAAVRAVLARLPEPRAGLTLGRLAAVAALLVAVALGAWLGARHTISTRDQSAEALATPPLPSNVMVFWIDPDTPVYFVLSPAGSGKGERS